MDDARRIFIKLGGGAAIGVLLASGAQAAENGAPSGGFVTPPPGDALRLATVVLEGENSHRVVAVRTDGHVVDLAGAAQARQERLLFEPSSMLSLVAAGPDALAQARRLAASGGPGTLQGRLLAPIPAPPRNIYAVGWNYLEHFGESLTAKQAHAALPEHPVFFTKGTHTINGPYDNIPYDPAVSTQIDWEGELAVIIGRRGRNIAEADAMGHVFGFTVINDTTARDMQRYHGGQWFKGKSLDGHGPLGPWIIPAADLEHDNLRLTTTVNGVIKQDINTRQMYFKVPRLIAELSLGLTLEPGDIIASGTPSGIGAARTPPEFLKPGDVMETSIERIGTIRNVIRPIPT
jgi:2-keto-4-pentenoate hydratase/2-oxohepta-3-ene-1,7-dioic acid hydratase in catechol pathway